MMQTQPELVLINQYRGLQAMVTSVILTTATMTITMVQVTSAGSWVRRNRTETRSIRMK